MMDAQEDWFTRITARLAVLLTVERPLYWVRRMQIVLLALTVIMVTAALSYPNLRQPNVDLAAGGEWDAGRNAPADFIADTEIEFVLQDQYQRAAEDAAGREPLRFTRDFGILSGQPDDEEKISYPQLFQEDMDAVQGCRNNAPSLAAVESCAREKAPRLRRLGAEELRSVLTLRPPQLAELCAQMVNLAFQHFVILAQIPADPAYRNFQGSSIRVRDLNRGATPEDELPREAVIAAREIWNNRNLQQLDDLALARVRGVAGPRRRALVLMAAGYLSKLEGAWFSPDETAAAQAAARRSILPRDHLYRIPRGEPVVKRGEVITPNARKALEVHQSRHFWETIWRLLGIFIQLATLTGLLLYFAMRLAARQLSAVSTNLIIFITFWLYAVALVFLESLWMKDPTGNDSTHFFGAWAPIGAFAVLFALIFGETLAILLALYLAFLTFIGSRYDGMTLLIALTIGLLGAVMGSRIQKRLHFINASVVLVGVALLLVCAGYLYEGRPILAPEEQVGIFARGYSYALLAALLSGSATVTIIGVLPVYETLFNIPTRFKLAELADASHPLLQEMFRRAPSTWQHTLMVSAMVEKACERLHLNVPLARTGIYFHDIGKMKNAGFFIENQHLIPKPENIDRDNPAMAARVIIDHVLDGIRMAEAVRLPREVIAFIPEHHGTSTMSFFYHKALEKMKRRVRREDFRYPGPIPQSRETGIAMIADSVEAASRSLDDITEESVNGLIQKIINGKLAENQLDESGLTVGDLRVVREAFKDVLMSALHSRPKYPEQSDTKRLEELRAGKARGRAKAGGAGRRTAR
ncbi:MAG: HDIG domain-containing protein [Leptospirales bacterium]|nr:HDIG domain-containing protein [Leptospirales bacterium]